ncbi:MAG: hypothetical protein J7559_12260 [Cohnella sp.]|nr:hypothetical protein [Cohnella sp.]
MKPVKYTMSQVNKYNEGFYSNNKYHTLHVAGVVPDSASGWQTNYFYTDGEVDISFDYLSYLVDSSGRRYGNTSGMYGNSRGQLDVYLVPQDAAGVRDEYKKLQVIDNMGTNFKQNFLSITDWSGAGQFRIRETVAAGRYTLVFQMTDKMPDDDYDGKNIYYYSAFRGLNVNVTDSTRGDAAEIDDTKVKVEFIDWDTGAVIDSRVYSKSNTANGYTTYDIYYPTPRGGKLYKVQYTLLKGSGTKGGLYGTGGTFSLTNGKFAEYWGEYCKDSNNAYYAKGHSPNPDVGGGGTGGEVIHVPTANSFCWIDAINIYLNDRPPCTGTKMEVFVDDVLTKTINSVVEAPITVNLTNNTTEVEEHTIRYVFTGGCYGDGVTIRGGHFKLTDKLLPAPSYAVVSDFSVTNNKPIWMGGCDGSGIRVKITNEAGTVLLNNVYASQTISTFRVTNLPVSPYSKYMVEVTTTQNGTVSDVTGLPYLTKFKMMDFKAYENYHNVADPFNGKLEFFIDGSLIDSYTAAGGFFTKSYPLPKGDHVLKWVFTELGTGNSWDFCEIDFLQVTKWICDSVTVTPYCEPGMGDKCVEALIRCLIDLWKQRPKACVIGKKTWLFT